MTRFLVFFLFIVNINSVCARSLKTSIENSLKTFNVINHSLQFSDCQGIIKTSTSSINNCVPKVPWKKVQISFKDYNNAYLKKMVKDHKILARVPGDIDRWNSVAIEQYKKLDQPIILTLPSGEKYQPLADETFISISEKFNISSDELIKKNKKVVKIFKKINDTEDTDFSFSSFPLKYLSYEVPEDCEKNIFGVYKEETNDEINIHVDIGVMVSSNSKLTSFRESDISYIESSLESIYGQNKFTYQKNNQSKKVKFNFNIYPVEIDNGWSVADFAWMKIASETDTGFSTKEGFRITTFPAMLRRSSQTQESGLQGGTSHEIIISPTATDKNVIPHELGHFILAHLHTKNSSLSSNHNNFDHSQGGILASPTPTQITDNNIKLFVESLETIDPSQNRDNGLVAR